MQALGSGEAEYYAALKGAYAALGFQSMFRDLGLKASVTLFTDSSATRGIIHRAGLGKLRHLETGHLWLQAAVKNKRLQVRQVMGTENPADSFNEALGCSGHVETLGDSPHVNGRRENYCSSEYLVRATVVPSWMLLQCCLC